MFLRIKKGMASHGGMFLPVIKLFALAVISLSEDVEILLIKLLVFRTYIMT